ncbi:hypothetical protein QYF61_014740 [Mycteria americana]|uniref:Uncharacterized protein n=1 Tax=Mycteria americana TaxID=33587 RepID=A0AAN7SF08_MYCAM|nr:hypothetical protein QYF61_014740 [Mycteria americana]
MSSQSAEEGGCSATPIVPADGQVSSGSVWPLGSRERRRLPSRWAPSLIFPRELFDSVLSQMIYN